MALNNALKNRKKGWAAGYFNVHYFSFIEGSFDEIADEILKWGWSSWWPKESVLQYEADAQDGLQAGLPCRMFLKGKFLTVVLKGEIVQIRPKRVLQIEWRSGWVTGQEFIIVEERSNGTRVDFRARFKGTMLLSKMIWLLFFRKKYAECIRQALDVFKPHEVHDQDLLS
jgi:hypothetical protein